jgi:hypothetical protein
MSFLIFLVKYSSSGQMPGLLLMKRTILRIRERENAAPGIPQSLYDLVIPEDYKKNIRW